jgi:hypothetical protein
MTATMQKLTRNDVREVARALITLNGETTNLDVKQALRKKGFWATQREVREFMLDITAKDSDMQYRDDNGVYRTYFFQTPDTPTTTISATLSTDPTNVPVASALVHASPSNNAWPISAPVVTVDPDDVPSDYEVASRTGGWFRRYFNVTRGEAKHRWSVDTGMPYRDARTTKIK